MSKQISKIYHAAIYVRLSKEDGDVSTSAKAESNSISNQKDFIRNFLADKKDIKIVKEYVDDGYSGSNFDRPSFQTMMEDIKGGIIDCVVVKDLSRFGREYIDSGRYIERLFPALGVRFIAINDNYDSMTGKSQGDEIIIPFKNLINDAYCRDISIKIRSHLEIKRKNGEYIGAFVPYGYQKSEADKHKIIIDTYAANVVSEIFRLKLHGMSQDAIARKLNDEGILSPMEYKQSIGSGYQTGFLQNEKSVWSSVTVRRILENEIYIGNLIQGKRTTPNHKVKQEVTKPEADWIRIEKNHEPIITDRDFEVVQRLLGMDTRMSPDADVVYNLSGIAVCADCGAPMTRKITTAGGKKYAYYICSNHKLTKQCSQHSISVQMLEDTVLEMLRLHISNVMDLEEILDFIGEIPFQQLDVKNLETRKQKKMDEVEKCKRLKSSLYEDMKDGILTKEEYLELHEAYLKKEKEGEENIRQIERDITLILEEKDDKHLWMNYFTEYKDIKELTRDVVVKLISEIRVSENKEIEIIFDFDDCYRQLLKSVGKFGYQVSVDTKGKLNISRREAV
jgi:DNA invertase Pin-like site-specific DNA recombinase